MSRSTVREASLGGGMAKGYASLDELWGQLSHDRTHAAYKDGRYYPVEEVSGVERTLHVNHHAVAAIKAGYGILVRKPE